MKTVDDFLEKYTPIKNHLDTDATFDGCMFETFGEEVNFVLSQDNNKIWTLVNGDGGDYIIPGFAYVNRIGYLITLESWESFDEEYLEYEYDDYYDDDDDYDDGYYDDDEYDYYAS